MGDRLHPKWEVEISPNPQDSARGFWTCFAEEPARYPNEQDQWQLARAYQRPGALSAAAGDAVRASTYEARAVARWAQAEPSLQLQVSAVG